MRLKKRTKQRVFRKVASYFLTGVLLFNSGDIMASTITYQKSGMLDKVPKKSPQKTEVSKATALNISKFFPFQEKKKGHFILDLDGYIFTVKEHKLLVERNGKKLNEFGSIHAAFPSLDRLKKGIYVLLDQAYPINIKVLTVNENKVNMIVFDTPTVLLKRNSFVMCKNKLIGIHLGVEAIQLSILDLSTKTLEDDFNIPQVITLEQRSPNNLFILPPYLLSAKLTDNNLIVIVRLLDGKKKKYITNLKSYLK